MGAMRSCLNEILPEFQGGSLGGGKNTAEYLALHVESEPWREVENILHYMWSLDLDVRSKCSV